MKNLIVLTAKSNLYRPVVDKMKSQVQPEDCLTLTQENYKDVLAQARIRPMFSKQYIIEAHTSHLPPDALASITRLLKGLEEKKPDDQYKFKKNSDNKWVRYHPDDLIPIKWTPKVTFIFICTTIGDFDKTVELCTKAKSQYVPLNCYKIPHEIFHRYISTNLNQPLNLTESKLLMSRLRTRYDLADTYISKLNRLNIPITSKVIKKHVPNFSRISFEKLWFYLLLQEPKTDKLIYSLYDDYRYGNQFFLKQLRMYSAYTLALYREFYNGDLTFNTRDEWFSNQNKPDKRDYNPTKHSPLDYKVPYVKSKYALEQYLKIFETVSFDKLLYIDMLLNEPIKSRCKLLETLMRIESGIL